jgi:hypothetical protein
MSTIDTFLTNILINHHDDLSRLVSTKDFKILKDLHSYTLSAGYITENQSFLILRILGNNQKNLKTRFDNISEILQEPHWAREFKRVQLVRKIFISTDKDNESEISIEFTFSANLKKIITKAATNIEKFHASYNGKSFSAALTEKNIVTLVDLLVPLDFEIDETIKNHYNTIKSWSETEIKNQYLLTSIDNAAFHKCITADLGIETLIDTNIINDRSVRYQYFTENIKNFGENLTEQIANRSKKHVWVDKSQHTLTEIIKSLKELKRLPLLVIFDNANNEKFMENLGLLNAALENNGIFEGVGIYFRLANDADGKRFNAVIAEKTYNHKLDENCLVAGILSGKIPKFFLKNPWKPMSVITLDTKIGLRHGKTAVYSNCCDLIVEWGENPTIIDQARMSKWR